MQAADPPSDAGDVDDEVRTTSVVEVIVWATICVDGDDDEAPRNLEDVCMHEHVGFIEGKGP